MSVTMNEMRMIVESSTLTDMNSSSNTTGALELSPAHPHSEQLLHSGEKLRDVDEHDKEDAIDHGVWHESQILLFHRDGVQRGRDIEQREQDPPVHHEVRRSRRERREHEEEISRDVEHRPDHRFEEHREQRHPHAE